MFQTIPKAFSITSLLGAKASMLCASCESLCHNSNESVTE